MTIVNKKEVENLNNLNFHERLETASKTYAVSFR